MKIKRFNEINEDHAVTFQDKLDYVIVAIRTIPYYAFSVDELATKLEEMGFDEQYMPAIDKLYSLLEDIEDEWRESDD